MTKALTNVIVMPWHLELEMKEYIPMTEDTRKDMSTRLWRFIDMVDTHEAVSFDRNHKPKTFQKGPIAIFEEVV